MSVEGIPPRGEVVTFTAAFASYFAGESACFTAEEAQRLIDLGVAEAPWAGPPENVDVPHVAQSGDTLSCTMGNWHGEPTSYAYQWQLDGADAGSNAAIYTVTAADVGKTATCTVTASNAAGSTTAPPSSPLVVADIARRRRS